MVKSWMPPPMSGVALLAEGVDRNRDQNVDNPAINRSPSSRRAWIEILSLPYSFLVTYVALLAEGVDRNSKRSCI